MSLGGEPNPFGRTDLRRCRAGHLVPEICFPGNYKVWCDWCEHLRGRYFCSAAQHYCTVDQFEGGIVTIPFSPERLPVRPRRRKLCIACKTARKSADSSPQAQADSEKSDIPTTGTGTPTTGTGTSITGSGTPLGAGTTSMDAGTPSLGTGTAATSESGAMSFPARTSYNFFSYIELQGMGQGGSERPFPPGSGPRPEMHHPQPMPPTLPLPPGDGVVDKTFLDVVENDPEVEELHRASNEKLSSLFHTIIQQHRANDPASQEGQGSDDDSEESEPSLDEE